jgi:hypothetical protein
MNAGPTTRIFCLPRDDLIFLSPLSAAHHFLSLSLPARSLMQTMEGSSTSDGHGRPRPSPCSSSGGEVERGCAGRCHTHPLLQRIRRGCGGGFLVDPTAAAVPGQLWLEEPFSGADPTTPRVDPAAPDTDPAARDGGLRSSGGEKAAGLLACRWQLSALSRPGAWLGHCSPHRSTPLCQ